LAGSRAYAGRCRGLSHCPGAEWRSRGGRLKSIHRRPMRPPATCRQPYVHTHENSTLK
jgi:hypothetical protein